MFRRWGRVPHSVVKTQPSGFQDPSQRAASSCWVSRRLPDHGGGRHGDRNAAHRRACLRGRDAGPATCLRDGAVDRDDLTAEIDVVPLRAQRFAAACAGGGDQHEVGEVPTWPERGQECLNLVGRVRSERSVGRPSAPSLPELGCVDLTISQCDVETAPESRVVQRPPGASRAAYSGASRSVRSSYPGWCRSSSRTSRYRRNAG